MPGLTIEREILIEAPVKVVWRTITEPDQISQWFADKVELVVEPGAHGYMEFGDQGGPVVVETVDPPTRFSFRWNHPRGEEPVPGNSMLVEFTLTPEDDERTRLRVTESGHELRAWPDAEKQRYADEHRDGWGRVPGPPGHAPRETVTGMTTQADDELWSAIGDPSRRQVLDLLVSHGEVSASWLAERVPFSRQAVSKHLVVLERAGLISRRKQGREVLYQVEAGRLDQATRTMTELAAQWDRRLATIKRLAETAHAENKRRPS